MVTDPTHRLDLLVCAQNEWYTQPIPCRARGGADTVITISGTWFLAVGGPDTPDLDAFLDKTSAQVERRLEAFQNQHPDVSGRTPALVIMDIEDPHPSDFHRHRTSTQDRLIEAFAVRAAAARTRFPNAKLGFYGTLVPDGRGRWFDKTYVARKRALVRAGERGMFDDVDCLVPVAYPRFGPTDAAWRTYDEHTRLAITGSRALRRSNGSVPPVIPLLTYSVANGNSNHHEDLLLDLPTPNPLRATLAVQLSVIVAEDVTIVVFWVGENSDLIRRLPNPNRRTVSQHLCDRRQLPAWLAG